MSGVTMYVVMRQDELQEEEVQHEPDRYEVIGTYAGANQKLAVKAAVDETNTGGAYVAVPVRSFQLVHVDIESTTRVKLS